MSSGEGGFVQRELKNDMQRAEQAPDAGKPMSAGFGGRATGLARRAGGGGPAANAPAELRFAADADREAKAAEQNVRNVGNRTFFRRDGQWVDSQVTKAQETNARRVKQFSDEYFELARTQGRRLSQYLVFDEPVLLNLDNQAYLIEP